MSEAASAEGRARVKVKKANRRMRKILVCMISVLVRYSTIRNVFRFFVWLVWFLSVERELDCLWWGGNSGEEPFIEEGKP